MRKKIFLAFGFCLLASLVVLAFLPTLAGSKWVIDPIVKRLAQDRFVLCIDSVQLRWLSPLQFHGITVKQDGDVPLLTIESVKSNRSLLGYLLGGSRLGTLEIVRPSVDVDLLADSSNLTNFINAVRTDDPKTTAQRSKPKIDLEIHVREMTGKVQQHASDAPLVVIPAFDLDFAYQAVDGDTHVVVQRSQVLKEVELSPDLMKLGLEYAVPVLGKSAWFDGKVSLEIMSADIYPDHPERSTAAALLTLHQVRSGPTNARVVAMIDMLARLRGRDPVHELVFVDGSAIEISLANERVAHSGLKFGLPKIDPRLQISSAGSVGLKDRSLDLNVELPIPVENLARRDEVKSLGVPTVNLPVHGTLDNPQPDWSVLRDESAIVLASIQEQLSDSAPVTAAAIGALEGAVGGDADELIKSAAGLAQELIEKRRAAKEAAAKEPANQQAPDAAQAPVRDALRGLLRGRRNAPAQ